MMEIPDCSTVRFWVISAWLPEQQMLREKIAGSLPASVREAEVCVFGEVGFICAGLGAVRAAANVGRIIAHSNKCGNQHEAILFVATAGCYSDDISIGSAHFCSEVLWSDGDLLERKSYLPGSTDGTFSVRSESLVCSSQSLVTVSTPGITTDDLLAQRLGKLGQLENLELYGIAEAARALGLSWAAALGVSNRVGTDSHKEWKENHVQASHSAQQMLFEQFLKIRISQ